MAVETLAHQVGFQRIEILRACLIVPCGTMRGLVNGISGCVSLYTLASAPGMTGGCAGLAPLSVPRGTMEMSISKNPRYAGGQVAIPRCAFLPVG
jgi:hypothetical protein